MKNKNWWQLYLGEIGSHVVTILQSPYRRSGELYVQFLYPGSKNQTNNRTRREGVSVKGRRLVEEWMYTGDEGHWDEQGGQGLG